jgi:hypothetical protein
MFLIKIIIDINNNIFNIPVVEYKISQKIYIYIKHNINHYLQISFIYM